MLTNKKVLVTAGPTIEPIDPVRYITNHSSGKMGYSIAEEFADRGADVVLISGPVNLDIKNHNIKRIDVLSAKDMYNSCIRHSVKADIIVMAAAVADYIPVKTEINKIKKKAENLEIHLKPTDDILKELGKRKKKNQLLVGFALETNDEIKNAGIKLHNKNLDFIVINSLRDKGAGFKTDTNKVKIMCKDNKVLDYKLKSKVEVAKDIVDMVCSKLKK